MLDHGLRVPDVDGYTKTSVWKERAKISIGLLYVRPEKLGNVASASTWARQAQEATLLTRSPLTHDISLVCGCQRADRSFGVPRMYLRHWTRTSVSDCEGL